MKKVAGTLRLDQANYRELEAFSKFGSDLDPATMAVLNKGSKNVEFLKQGQYQPVPIEHQIAIIYCGTKGLLKDIPVNRVREFEKEFIEFLELKYKNELNQLAEGKFGDEITNVLDSVVADLSQKYKA